MAEPSKPIQEFKLPKSILKVHSNKYGSSYLQDNTLSHQGHNNEISNYNVQIFDRQRDSYSTVDNGTMYDMYSHRNHPQSSLETFSPNIYQNIAHNPAETNANNLNCEISNPVCCSPVQMIPYNPANEYFCNNDHSVPSTSYPGSSLYNTAEVCNNDTWKLQSSSNNFMPNGFGSMQQFHEGMGLYSSEEPQCALSPSGFIGSSELKLNKCKPYQFPSAVYNRTDASAFNGFCINSHDKEKFSDRVEASVSNCEQVLENYSLQDPLLIIDSDQASSKMLIAVNSDILQTSAADMVIKCEMNASINHEDNIGSSSHLPTYNETVHGNEIPIITGMNEFSSASVNAATNINSVTSSNIDPQLISYVDNSRASEENVIINSSKNAKYTPSSICNFDLDDFLSVITETNEIVNEDPLLHQDEYATRSDVKSSIPLAEDSNINNVISASESSCNERNDISCIENNTRLSTESCVTDTEQHKTDSSYHVNQSPIGDRSQVSITVSDSNILRAKSYIQSVSMSQHSSSMDATNKDIPFILKGAGPSSIRKIIEISRKGNSEQGMESSTTDTVPHMSRLSSQSPARLDLVSNIVCEDNAMPAVEPLGVTDQSEDASSHVGDTGVSRVSHIIPLLKFTI